MIIIENIFILIGTVFLFLGALGLVRMPNVYNRIQAGTKAATLSVLAILLGVAFHHPAWLPKILLIALFILLTSTIARAVYKVSNEYISFYNFIMNRLCAYY
ncbi:MAG: monovalent cation/H(+) antiporter subunit G [Candidatus Marithrix sp.]